jgi:hypothetical protein
MRAKVAAPPKPGRMPTQKPIKIPTSIKKNACWPWSVKGKMLIKAL